MIEWLVYVITFDAVAVIGLGLLYALLTILGLDRSLFWERIAPAVVMLVATSLAAGLMMLGAAWIVQ